MKVNRSGFYKWLKRRSNPSQLEINRTSAFDIFREYHNKYPSHGYRWLNAKIKLDTGTIYSNNYAHKICRFLNIKSDSKHVRRYGKKANKELKNFPNYILAEFNPLRPFQLIVTDMTAFWANSHYYELTLFMDLFNNEIIAYYLADRKGNPEAYHIALAKVIDEKNKKYMDLEMILHSDQGSVYCSKRFNESLYLYNIIHSTSKPGTPTENGAMEAINGRINEELIIDFNINNQMIFINLLKTIFTNIFMEVLEIMANKFTKSVLERQAKEMKARSSKPAEEGIRPAIPAAPAETPGTRRKQPRSKRPYRRSPPCRRSPRPRLPAAPARPERQLPPSAPASPAPVPKWPPAPAAG